MAVEFIKSICTNHPAAVGLTIAAPVTAYLIYKQYWDKTSGDPDKVNETLFFSYEGLICKSHFHQKIVDCSLDSCPFNKIRRMIDYIVSAKQTLDICLYLITVKDLADAIVKAKRRGVKIRIITDEDMANGSGSQMIRFRDLGMKVRNQHKTTTLMHHKFVIIDRRILMTGSLNWTMQAVCGNWDNLIITSEPDIVKGFIDEYDRIWEIFCKTA